MTAWDFVIGVLFGIVVSCEHYPRIPKEARMLIGVLILKASSSWFKTLSCEVYVLYIRVIRPCRLYADQVCNGRIYGKFPSRQPYYVYKVCRNSTLCFVACSPFAIGFLFFGTITYVEESIRSLIEGPSWQNNPVQFLVLDLALVAGVDMSSAEAFVRIHRLLAAKYVTLVFCGFKIDSPVGKALRSVDVLGADGVELFLTFNDAIECM